VQAELKKKNKADKKSKGRSSGSAMTAAADQQLDGSLDNGAAGTANSEVVAAVTVCDSTLPHAHACLAISKETSASVASFWSVPVLN
jgi:hypothetical protein